MKYLFSFQDALALKKKGTTELTLTLIVLYTDRGSTGTLLPNQGGIQSGLTLAGAAPRLIQKLTQEMTTIKLEGI